MNEAAIEEAPRAAMRRRYLPEMTIARASFLLSVTLAGINLFYAMRGSVIVVQPVEQVVFLRDGSGPNAILTLVVRLQMVNVADSAHGDVLRSATLTPVGRSPSFAASGPMRLAFTDRQTAPGCPTQGHCVALPGFVASEEEDTLLSVPGGGGRVVSLAFPIVPWNCSGKAGCAGYADFEAALATIGRKPTDITLNLRFYSDGTRILHCRFARTPTEYIRRIGWAALRCRDAAGAPDMAT